MLASGYRRYVSVVLTLALLVAGGFAAYAIARSAVSTDAEAPGADAGQLRPPASPTPAITPDGTLEEARARLARQSPQMNDVVEAALGGDIAALLAHFEWKPIACLEDGVGGRGLSLYCSRLGLPPGSGIQIIEEYVGFYLERERSNVATVLGAVLVANPRLELVAAAADGTIAISIAIDERRSDIADSRVNAVMFYLDPASLEPVTTYREVPPSSTSIDQLRNEEIFMPDPQKRDWGVWGLSDELVERERARHADRYDDPIRNAPPPPFQSP